MLKPARFLKQKRRLLCESAKSPIWSTFIDDVRTSLKALSDPLDDNLKYGGSAIKR